MGHDRRSDAVMIGVLSPSDLSSRDEGREVTVGGRVRAAGDGFGITDALGYVPLVGPPDAVDDGDLVRVRGIVGTGPSLRPVSIERLGAPHRRAAAQDTARFHGGVGAALVARARALRAVRATFESMGFLEVETPIVVPCPGLDTHLDAFEAIGAKDPRYLITSPEYQMKRLLVGGLPRIFQVTKTFRRAELGARHNPEFTMLEFYRAFEPLDAIVADTEAVLVAVNAAVASPASTFDRLDLARPFPRISVAEAFSRFASVGEVEMLNMADHDEESFFRILVDRVEPALSEMPSPVVLHRYPASMASLARLCEDDRRYAERFELYAAGVELCNGFGELTDPDEQAERFAKDRAERARRGLPVYPVDEAFVRSLREGMPPASGNAVGYDRLVMLAYGASSLGEVISFPEEVL